jgi:DNA segregation ATPase FtsK/SpoIIIE-like protein
MKKIIKFPAIVLGLLLLLTGITQKTMAQDDDISLQSFYDELSPYGAWTQDSEYGYVWRPDVGQDDFRPYYTNGRWAMTEYGNTWVSDYDWGWAPFHYGRWVLNRYQQWIWLPDTVWGPAWVSWRSGGGYYGWAPLGPGINININIGGGYNPPNNWWVFIPQRSIYDNRYPRYSGRNVTIINQTTIINNTYRRNRNTYYMGPRADEIRRVTNRDVKVYNVSRANRPGRTSISNNNINIYNPRFGRSGNNTSGTSTRPGQPDRNNTGRGNYQGQRRDMDGRNSQSGQERVGQVQRGTERGNQPNQQQVQQRQQEQLQRQQRGQHQREGQQIQQQAQQQQQLQQRESQRQQQMQQRQQQTQQQAQQRQQEQQQRESQRQQQTQQQAQQRQQEQQQRESQRQQQTQQRQQEQQQRQQQMQQRQQQQQQQSTPPARSGETRGRSGGGETRGGRGN